MVNNHLIPSWLGCHACLARRNRLANIRHLHISSCRLLLRNASGDVRCHVVAITAPPPIRELRFRSQELWSGCTTMDRFRRVAAKFCALSVQRYLWGDKGSEGVSPRNGSLSKYSF